MKQTHHQTAKQIVRNSLIHFGSIWIILVITFTLRYAYVVIREGHGWQTNTDGSLTTLFQYFVMQMTHREFLPLLGAAFIIELLYTYIFRKVKFYWFVVFCFILGFLTVLDNLLRLKHNLGLVNMVDLAGPIFFIEAYLALYCWIRDYFYQQAYYKELRIQKSENELSALKAQLNPHFLFNSLNHLYGSALKEQATVTADGIDRLSSMMRYTISGMQHNFVPLNDEIEFIRNYISLQKDRLPDASRITFDEKLNRDYQNLTIAPLILLPFLENAFKYGVSHNQDFQINIRLGLDRQTIKLNVSNTIVKQSAEVKGTDTGLRNTLKRLDLLYPGKYQLAQKNEGVWYDVSLAIELSPSK